MCVRQVCFEWLKLDDRCTRYVSVGTRQGNERGISIGGWPGRLCMYETSRPFPTGDMPGGQGMHGMSGVSMLVLDSLETSNLNAAWDLSVGDRSHLFI